MTRKQKLKATGSLIDALFSKVRQRILAIFFGRPSARLQLSQVIALANSGRGAVQRELENLVSAGLLHRHIVDGRKLYAVNRESPVFEELRGLILKTVGLLEPLTKSLQALASKVDVAFVYGSVAKEEDTANSDIDLMIIARDVAYPEIFEALQKAEKKLRRPINPNIMAPDEWKQKLSEKNSFITRIANQPKLFVFGSDHDLERIGQSG